MTVVQAEILCNGQSTHSAALTGIVDGIHIAPVQTRIRERFGSALCFHLQRTNLALHIPKWVFINANNGASLDCVMPGFSPCLSLLLILQLLLLLFLLLLSILLLLALPSVDASALRRPFITQE